MKKHDQENKNGMEQNLSQTWSRKQGTQLNRTFNKHDQENKERNRREPLTSMIKKTKNVTFIKKTKNGTEQNGTFNRLDQENKERN